jgi:hypothetical protein
MPAIGVSKKAIVTVGANILSARMPEDMRPRIKANPPVEKARVAIFDDMPASVRRGTM